MYFSFTQILCRAAGQAERGREHEEAHLMKQYTEESIQLISCGREDCADMHSWGPGIRSCYIIHYIIRGAGWLECGRRRFRVEAGQSFLLYPYTLTRYYPDPELSWEYTWVDFVGKEAASLLADAGLSPSSPVTSRLSSPHILPLYERLTTLDIHSRSRREADGLLYAILGSYADAFSSSSASLRRSGNDRLSTALLLIQTGFHRPGFNVERLCLEMNINRVTLYRLFTDSLGISPNRYISRYRLEQAKKLLKMGFSVKNTALSCGFSDPFYFSKAFRSYTGDSPTAYRDRESDASSSGRKSPAPPELPGS